MFEYELEKEKDEEIIFTLRKHWFDLFSPLLKAFVLFLGFLIIFTWVGSDAIFSSFLLLMIFLAIFIFITTYALYEWILWYLDIYILTNQRIIDVEQKTLFSRQVAEASLEKIQDVTYKIEGVFATLFNYGTVSVQTAGAEDFIHLDKIAKPDKVQKKIMDSVEDFGKNQDGPVTAEELIEAIKEKRKENQIHQGDEK